MNIKKLTFMAMVMVFITSLTISPSLQARRYSYRRGGYGYRRSGGRAFGFGLLGGLLGGAIGNRWYGSSYYPYSYGYYPYYSSYYY